MGGYNGKNAIRRTSQKDDRTPLSNSHGNQKKAGNDNCAENAATNRNPISFSVNTPSIDLLLDLALYQFHSELNFLHKRF